MATLDCCPVSSLGAAPLLPRVPGALTLETFLPPSPSQGEICPTELHPKPVGTAGIRWWRGPALHRPHLRANPSAWGTERSRGAQKVALRKGWPRVSGVLRERRGSCLLPGDRPSLHTVPASLRGIPLFLSPSPLKAQPLSSAHPSVAEPSSSPSSPHLYEFARAAIITFHRLGGLNSVSQLWRLQVTARSVCQQDGCLPRPFSLACKGLCSPCAFTCLPVHVCIPSSLFL